jgi:hypothetical protein
MFSVSGGDDAERGRQRAEVERENSEHARVDSNARRKTEQLGEFAPLGLSLDLAFPLPLFRPYIW